MVCKQDRWRIAIYMRLSKDSQGDSSEEEQIRTESNSISMQRLLIRKYIEKHFEDVSVSEYQDDGYSGTNFNRPGVQRLLNDARDEKIDCIIVKDFSRFGRDYIELGSYLEQIFPFLGIRFISINDQYDSERSNGTVTDLDVNFKNLLYDLYSKDLSEKVRSSLQIKKEAGQYISANAPFGYEKTPNDRHMLVPEEDEAEVVRRIFSLTLQGLTSSQVAKRLNEEYVPTPVEFKIRKGKTSRKPKGDRFYWDSSVICSILRNSVYVGDMVYGKTKKDKVGGRNVLKPREEWKVFRNHHPPLVAREDFEKVQKTRGRKSLCYNRNGNSKQKQEGDFFSGGKSPVKSPLSGLLVCGSCGKKLQLRNGLNPYYRCVARYVTDLPDCVKKANAMFLEQAVWFRIEEHIAGQTEDKEWSGKIQARKYKAKRDSLQKELRRSEHELAEWKQKHYESYLAYSFGEQPEFHSFQKEIEKCSKRIREAKEQLYQFDKLIHDMETKYSMLEETDKLTKELLEHYIERVVVFADDRIEMIWKENAVV